MTAVLLIALAAAIAYWTAAEFGDDIDAMISAMVVCSLLCATAVSSNITLSSRIGIGMMIALVLVVGITTVISIARKEKG